MTREQIPPLAGRRTPVVGCAPYKEAPWTFRHFGKWLTKNPNGFLGRYGLGNKIIQEGGDMAEAVEHLSVAVKLDPTHVASHLALGRALVRSIGTKKRNHHTGRY